MRASQLRYHPEAPVTETKVSLRLDLNRYTTYHLRDKFQAQDKETREQIIRNYKVAIINNIHKYPDSTVEDVLRNPPYLNPSQGMVDKYDSMYADETFDPETYVIRSVTLKWRTYDRKKEITAEYFLFPGIRRCFQWINLLVEWNDWANEE